MTKTIVGIDTETFLFGPGNMAPRVVCLSWAFNDRCGLMHRDDVENWLRGTLNEAISGNALIVGHNICYDMACVLATFPELGGHIWAAYDAGAILCTKIREKLLDIAEGNHGGEIDHKGKRINKKYGLADIVKRYFDKDRDKETWRLRYGELDSIPIEEWPEGAKDYPIEDSTDVLAIYDQQESRSQALRYPFPDQVVQARADFSLQLMSCWGLRTDGDKVVKLKTYTDERMAELKIELQEAGLVRRKTTPKSKESKDTAAIRAMIERSFSGGAVPRTKTGKMKTDSDTLEMCDDPISGVLSEYNSLQKSSSSFIDKLSAGINLPIHPSYNILVNTGRTSSYNPNIQQPPRVGGVRECYIPSDGCVFVACDYDNQELRAWAQVCLDLVGESTLANKFQADPSFDAHLDFASNMLGITYEEGKFLKKEKDPKMKEYRQQAKPANFGFPVGMGFKKFRKYARGYKLIITEEQSEILRTNWYTQWPEAQLYFDEINRIVGDAGYGSVIQIRSNRRRGMCRYTVAANTLFQGLAADASKAALWLVAMACYYLTDSPLYGCRPVIFAHDEIILNAPEAIAHEAALELQRLMIMAMEAYTPDIPIRASSALMRCWKKDVDPVYNEHGRLIPWEDAA